MIKWMFQIDFRRKKRYYLLLFLTLLFCTAALTAALLLVRSAKLQDADTLLKDYGNYDCAFCEVTDALQERIEADARFSELGYVYDYGEITFTASGNTAELGALLDAQAESMYYVNPVAGRYPEQEGEICIDRVTLKSNGYTETLGQEIPISYQTEDGETIEQVYTLVGIVEVQLQDAGEIYCARRYPEEMYSTTNSNEVNFPFAYISRSEADQNFASKKTHILANVSSEENADDVISEYLTSYLEGSDETTQNMHIITSFVLGREWVSLCILGEQMAQSGTNTEALAASVANGEVQQDAYTKYFIPIFTILIILISAVGMFDAMRLSAEESRENYGILLGMGMTGKRILKYILLEVLILFLLAMAGGWCVGALAYRLLLCAAQSIFSVSLPSVFSFDAYYLPYVEMATKNPWVWSALVAVVVMCAGTVGLAVDLLRMTPVKLEQSAIKKHRYQKKLKNVYRVLNHAIGKTSLLYRAIPYATVGVVMAAAVFGFLFFRAKAQEDTATLSSRVEEARVNGVDYYMCQTGAVMVDYEKYMHESGVTEEMFAELANNELVETAQGVVVNPSTMLICGNTDDLSMILQQQSEYDEITDNSAIGRIYNEAGYETFRYLGVDTDTQEVFQVPTVGVDADDLARFEGKVLAGEIDASKLAAGEEAVVMVTDESLAEYFTVGSALPLYARTRPADYDNSAAALLGQLPEGYENDEPAFSVTIDDQTCDFWCYDTLEELPVTIGAVVLVDAEDAFYYDDEDKGYTVNLLTVKDAYAAWGLPDENYTRVGVCLKDADTSDAFENVWLDLLQSAKYMVSTDVYSILREEEATENQVMAIFYSVLGVLLIVSLLCTGNSIVMRIRRMAKEQRILRLLGMTKKRLLILYIRRYLPIAGIGMVISAIPPVVYTMLVRHASALRQLAYENDTSSALEAQKPWVYLIPSYDMLHADLIVAVIVSGAIAALVLALLVLTQAKRLEHDMEVK